MKIKTTICTIVLMVASIFSTTSCSDFLDKEPDTELTMNMVFENKDKVIGILQYIYGGIPNPTKFAIEIAWDTMSDDLVLNKSLNWAPFDSWARVLGTWTPSSSWAGNFWSDYPKRIRQGLLFLQNIHAIEGITESEVELMKAEVRFLMAYYWWNLTETYGPIPFTPGYLFPQDASLSELLTPRVPFDEIVEYLDNELLEVSKLLPAKYENTEKYGRATSIMCLTVRARMLLFAASPLVNGNSWYADYANNDGTMLFNSIYDGQKWVKAADACKLAIEEAENAGHALFTIYNSDGTIDPFKSTANIYFTLPSAGNNEITFPVTNFLSTNHRNWENLAHIRGLGGANCLGVYQGLVDAYFMSNGLPAISGYNSDGTPIVNTVSGYTENGFSTAIEKRTTAWDEGTGVAGEITGVGTFNMYCNREPRFYTTVNYHGSWCAALKRKFDFMYLHSDNNHSWNAPRNGYLVRRKVHPTTNETNGVYYDNRPEWLYRLATNYLDYAEAINEAYDNNASRQEALKFLNQIRVRAGVRQYTMNAVAENDASYIHVADNQESVRKIVRMERRVELACEGIRYIDIRRWMIAEDIPEMNGPLMGLNWNSDQSDTFFTRTANLDQTRVWQQYYYWMPIYIDEIDKNPNLVQAPFWN